MMDGKKIGVLYSVRNHLPDRGGFRIMKLITAWRYNCQGEELAVDVLEYKTGLWSWWCSIDDILDVVADFHRWGIPQDSTV